MRKVGIKIEFVRYKCGGTRRFVLSRVALEILIINVIVVVVFKHFHVHENKSVVETGSFIFI